MVRRRRGLEVPEPEIPVGESEWVQGGPPVARRRGLAGLLVLVGAALIVLGCTVLAVWLGLLSAGLFVGGFGMLWDYDADGEGD